MRPLRILAGVLCAGILAAACSSTKPPHRSSLSVTPNQSSTVSTTTGATVVTTTTTVPSNACPSVSATAGMTDGAAGTITGTITLAPVGSASCTMMGYPKLTLLGSGGTVLPVINVDGLTVNISGPATEAPMLITVTPTKPAEFTYQYSDVTTSTDTGPCPSTTSIAVSSPGATKLSAPIPLVMAPCSNGTVRVSPVYTAVAGG